MKPLSRPPQLLQFEWSLECWGANGILYWWLPLVDRKAVKFLKLLWTANNPGACCVAKRTRYSCEDIWCTWVKFRREGSLYRKIWFTHCGFYAPFAYIWESRGRLKSRRYTAELAPFRTRKTRDSLGQVIQLPPPLIAGDLDGYRLSPAMKKALRRAVVRDEKPF